MWMQVLKRLIVTNMFHLKILVAYVGITESFLCSKHWNITIFLSPSFWNICKPIKSSKNILCVMLKFAFAVSDESQEISKDDVPVMCSKGTGGGGGWWWIVVVLLYWFLNWVLGGGSLLMPSPGQFTPRNDLGGPRAGLDGCEEKKLSFPTGVRTLNRPACSESLYQLAILALLGNIHHTESQAWIMCCRLSTRCPSHVMIIQTWWHDTLSSLVLWTRLLVSGCFTTRKVGCPGSQQVMRKMCCILEVFSPSLIPPTVQKG